MVAACMITNIQRLSIPTISAAIRNPLRTRSTLSWAREYAGIATSVSIFEISTVATSLMLKARR